MFFKPKVVMPSGPVRVLLLFSNSLSASLYLISETEKNPSLKEQIAIVGAATDNMRASDIKTLDMKNIYYRSFDRNLFASKREGTASKVNAEYILKIKELTAEFKPTLVLLDNFTLDGASIENVFQIPVLEDVLVCMDGTKITTFSGENAVRNAILSGKKEFRGGAFIYINGKRHLVALSRKFQLDIQKLASISLSDDFERYVKISNKKYIWNCSGPVIVKALELIASGRIEEKGGRLYIKEGGSSIQGFYNMITECVQGIYGIETPQ